MLFRSPLLSVVGRGALRELVDDVPDGRVEVVRGGLLRDLDPGLGDTHELLSGDRDGVLAHGCLDGVVERLLDRRVGTSGSPSTFRRGWLSRSYLMTTLR